jgi:TetR/AcrR family transcriptional repressor of nem operon
MMPVIRKGDAMNRKQQKEETRQRILGTAVRRLRELGLEGAGVNAVMKESGLTHGGFYAHFDSKDDLAARAMAEATREQRQRWITGIEETPRGQRVARLLARYLSPVHRDSVDGCPVPSVAAGVAHASDEVREAFEQELLGTVDALEELLDDEGAADARQKAIGTMALCIGGMVMARAVPDTQLSDEILLAARNFAGGVKHRRGR